MLPTQTRPEVLLSPPPDPCAGQGRCDYYHSHITPSSTTDKGRDKVVDTTFTWFSTTQVNGNDNSHKLHGASFRDFAPFADVFRDDDNYSHGLISTTTPHYLHQGRGCDFISLKQMPVGMSSCSGKGEARPANRT